jgi:hypothetical protein
MRPRLLVSLLLVLAVAHGGAACDLAAEPEDDGGLIDPDVGEDDERSDQANPTVACVDPASGEPEREDCVIHGNVGRAVRKFLRANPRLYELRAGHTDFSTCPDYRVHLYERDLGFTAAEFLAALATTPPAELWSGASQWRLTYDRRTGEIFEHGDDHPPLGPGMVMLMALKVIPGIWIPVGLEIVELDAAAGRFSIAYLAQNKTQGLQQLVFTAREGGSHVRHESRYQSDSEFRDARFYVPFHERFLADFYEAMEARLGAR